jgi:O-antigen/teichoic acid export membrane protein
LAALNLFRAVIAGQREFGKVSLIDVVRACLVLAAVCVAVEISVHATSRRVHLIVLGNSVAILFSAVIYLKCLGRTRVRVDRRSFRTAPELVGAMAYAAPAYLANLIQYLNYRVDVFFVSGISGVAAVGNYQLAVMIAESLRVLPTATQAVIWPTIASRQKDERANANLAVRSARAVFFVTLMASAVVAIVGMLTIPVFFGQAYAPSVNALLALLPGLAMFAVTTVLAGYIAGTGRPELNLRASAAGLVATIVLDCVLIPRYGILGAAVASSISYTITTAWTLLLVARLANVPVRELLLPARDDFLLYRRMLTEFRRRPAA